MEPERIELSDRVEYKLNGLFHRDDGPAIIYNSGAEEWYRHGELHRENGPAITDKYDTYGKYYLYNRLISRRNYAFFKEWIIKGRQFDQVQAQLEEYQTLGSYERVAHLVSLGEIAEHCDEEELPLK